MTLSVTIDNFEGFESQFNEIKAACQAAMANRYASIIHNNFGVSGEDRPKEWPALSEKYALDWHDGDTTPKLQLFGDLQASIEIDDNNPEYSSVFTNNEYAEAHQWGIAKKLRARPFFPLLENGELTPYSEAECIEAAQREMKRVLNQS